MKFNNLKVGDRVRQQFVGEWTVIEVFTQSCLLYSDKDEDYMLRTFSDLEKSGYTLVTPEVVEEWPEEGETYWVLNMTGETESRRNFNPILTDQHRNFLGIYRTEAEALAAKERILASVKKV